MFGGLKERCGGVAGALWLWHRGNHSLWHPHNRSLLLRSHERGLKLKASLTPPLLQAAIAPFQAAGPSWYCLVQEAYAVRLSLPFVLKA